MSSEPSVKIWPEALLATANVWRSVQALYEPAPERHAGEWALAERVLPIGTAEPGPFKVSRTPYMVPFLQACSSDQYKEVTLITGTQQAKTDNVCNVMGHVLQDRPSPLVYYAPTKDFVEQTFEPRFVAMVDSSEVLRGRMARGKRERLPMKRFGGIKVRLGWTGSASSLAGDPARKVFVDELDLMELNDKRHGDPLERAHARHTTFVDGQTIVTSTPTLGRVEVQAHPETGLFHWEPSKDVQSPIWQRWQEGTRHQWMLPCPECETPFFPRLELMRYAEDVRPQEIREVFLECPHCKRQIAEHEKDALFEKAVALAPGQTLVDGKVVGTAPNVRRFSLAVSGLFSPWRSWLVAVQRYREAIVAGDTKRQQAIVNTEFGELYGFTGEIAHWQDVKDRCEVPLQRGVMPADARVLVCSVDIQKRRMIYGVRAFGPGMSSWAIELGELWGETEFDSAWVALSQLLGRTWDGMPISCMFVDSGYRPGSKESRPTNQIYKFCRQHVGRAWPTKGHDHQEKPLKPSKIDMTLDGKVLKDALELWHIDTDFFKSWLHARLTWPVDQPGRWLVHEGAPDDYYKQLVAEVRVAVGSKSSWVTLRSENHFLDVEAMNVAAAFRLNLHIAMPQFRVGGLSTAAAPTKRRVLSKGVSGGN